MRDKDLIQVKDCKDFTVPPGPEAPGPGQGEDPLLISTALFLRRLWDQRLSGAYLPALGPSVLLGSRT